MDQVGPNDVRVGLGEDVPIHVWTLLPCPLNHIKELVLVEVPSAANVLGALLLRDGTVELGLVEVEFMVLVLDFLINAVEDVLEVVFANLLLLFVV
jgi:hypothetical protein